MVINKLRQREKEKGGKKKKEKKTRNFKIISKFLTNFKEESPQ